MDPTFITTMFTNKGVPATGLSPVIKIWHVTDSGDTLVVNSDPMVEVGDGFYKYEFTSYDPENNYLFRTDGGATLPIAERYQDASNQCTSADAAHLTWEEQRTDHLTTGSMGEAQNNILADVTQLRLDVTSMYALVNLLVKFERNRTRIDKDNQTLIVYDDDGVTELHVFDLFNSNGDPSTAEVCERVPQ